MTKQDRVRSAIQDGTNAWPGSRSSSWFNTGSKAYLSKDGNTMVALIYPPGNQTFTAAERIKDVRAALQSEVPDGVTVHLTGRDPLVKDVGGGSGPSLLVEILIGVAGALLVLLFVFGTLPAVLVPLIVAACSILTTFTLILALTYVTDVSIIVQYLVALVGLGVAIDYSLLMIFRFREELHHGRSADDAVVQTMIHAGRSVIVSGSTVAIGLLSMILLPLPFIRSIGIGGMLIPAVSVIGAITLVPALLSLLGHRIDSARVIPKRIIAADPGEQGFWHRWAAFVVRRPVPVLLIGLAIVVGAADPGVQHQPRRRAGQGLSGQGRRVRRPRRADRSRDHRPA